MKPQSSKPAGKMGGGQQHQVDRFALVGEDYYVVTNHHFYPQPLRPVGVLFSPMVYGWVGWPQKKVCLGCI